MGFPFSLFSSTKIEAADFQPGNFPFFGADVAISGTGNVAVISAPSDNNRNGSVYVFTRGQDGWTQQAKLTASDGEEAGSFGRCVAIDGAGSIIAVGAVGPNRTGTVYIFQWSGASWDEVQKVTAIGNSFRRRAFGVAIALSGGGSTLVVGDPEADELNSGRFNGRAYVFRSPTQQAFLFFNDEAVLVPSGSKGDNFGGYNSVGISDDGNTVVVGASGENAANVYINHSDGGWLRDAMGTGVAREVARLVASDSDPRGEFGRTVAISAQADFIVIGDRRQFIPTVYVFPSHERGWGFSEEEAKLQQRHIWERNFADSVAIRHTPDETIVLVGSPYQNVWWFGDAGAVFLFRRHSRTWYEQTVLTSSTPGLWNEFGASVAVNSGTGSFSSTPTAIVGAPRSDRDRGSAHVFHPTKAGFLGPMVATMARVLSNLLHPLMFIRAIRYKNRR